ncbi:MAG: class I SAM-dependent methyltransferase [Actinomycetota bacterium]|nr:class I SAM-dependent methyltransferase [Actinomycetota bacterium]
MSTGAEPLLPFTAHRMDLGGGEQTIADDRGEDPLCALSTAALGLALGGFAGQRVLDLGSLEGGFTIAFARLGASEAIGVEARELNLRRANWARDRLGVARASFQRGDVIELGSMGLGTFDAVFASGILYHLTDPFTFVEKVFTMTRDVALFDTNVALPAVNNHDTGPLITREHGGHRYEGRVFTEFPEPPGALDLEAAVWSAWGNTNSFWLTERSLVELLDAVGFTYLHKVITPAGYQCGPGCPPDCRVLYVAKRRLMAGSSRRRRAFPRVTARPARALLGAARTGQQH